MSERTITQSKNSQMITTIPLTMLVILRVAIGWHFLYEGIAKLFIPNWSSMSYLVGSRWIFSDFFKWLASNPDLVAIVDFLNIWGLILIGLGLIFGCLTRIASIAGAALLLLYYLAYPPFVGLDFGVPSEGHYLVVDKILIELFALCVLALIPTGTFLGLDRFITQFRKKRMKVEPEELKIRQAPASKPLLDRREIVKSLATLPFLGAFAYAVARKKALESYEEKNLVDAVTSATIKSFNFSSLNDLKGQVPHAKIGEVDFSRVILGGNLIGGWAHARDLIYVSKLVKAYHHREKVFETLLLAEKCGINALLTNPILCKVINDYWRRNIGKIKFISDCGGEDLLERVRMSIDNGAAACYVQGQVADQLAAEGKVDLIAKALDLIRQNGLPAGIGGHYLETIKKCVAYGLEPDFWVKTLHHRNYWSAQHHEEHDNVYCRKPEETIEFMKSLQQPWIAFKILAAGAIHPKDGFRFAFENGADFICVGMYDFQIVDDVNIALEVFNGELQRNRPWAV